MKPLTIEEQLKPIDQLVEEFKRDHLHGLLNVCSLEQQDFFYRLYPDGVESVPEKNLVSAIGLCKRTITNNIKGR